MREKWTTDVPRAKVDENTVCLHQRDKIVRRLDEFPELVQALRDGDRLAARLLFAQLFDGDSEDRIEMT